MFQFLIHSQLDLIGFTVFAVGLAIAIDRFWLRAQMDGNGIPRLAWAAMGLVIVGGCALGIWAGEVERTRLQQMVAGFAPTYASEMKQDGIEQLDLHTPPDDPTYLALIERQKNWLAANPVVADIYTLMRDRDGQTVLLVDSETDYDRDGRFAGDREKRTPIGEKFDHRPDEVARAFAGHSVFIAEPYTDRWGTWVTALVPIKGNAGQVVGVLGVDYPADTWITAIFFHRSAMLGLANIAGLMVFGVGAALTIRRVELERIARVKKLLVNSRQELSQVTDGLHERVEQRTRDLERAKHEAARAMRARNTAVVEFCQEVRRRLAAAAQGDKPQLGAANDDVADFEDAARLEIAELAVDVQPAPTLEIITAAVATARSRLRDRGHTITTVFADSIPAVIATDAARLSRAIVRSCELVAASRIDREIRLCIGLSHSSAGQPALRIDFTLDAGATPNGVKPGLFAERPPQAPSAETQPIPTSTVLRQIAARLGGQLIINRGAADECEVQLSVAAGCLDGVDFIDPVACTARLAA